MLAFSYKFLKRSKKKLILLISSLETIKFKETNCFLKSLLHLICFMTPFNSFLHWLSIYKWTTPQQPRFDAFGWDLTRLELLIPVSWQNKLKLFSSQETLSTSYIFAWRWAYVYLETTERNRKSVCVCVYVWGGSPNTNNWKFSTVYC